MASLSEQLVRIMGLSPSKVSSAGLRSETTGESLAVMLEK